MRDIGSLRRGLTGLILALFVLPVLAADPRITLTGSSTVAPLMLEIGKRYEKLFPPVLVDVQMGGSTRGVVDARSGLADVGMVSRSLTADEADLTAYTIAMDGIGIILHQSNPVAALTDAQVIAIYTGKLQNWHELGGPDLPITVVNKAEGRSTLELFLQYYRLKNSQTSADMVIGDNQQGIKSVAGNPGAIGYVSVGAAEYEVLNGTPIKQLPMNGMTASVVNVRNGSFPLSRPLNLVVRGIPHGQLEKLIRFARSAEVHDLIEAQFFVPLAHE